MCEAWVQSLVWEVGREGHFLTHPCAHFALPAPTPGSIDCVWRVLSIVSLDISVTPSPLVPSGEQQKLVCFEAAVWGPWVVRPGSQR